MFMLDRVEQPPPLIINRFQALKVACRTQVTCHMSGQGGGEGGKEGGESHLLPLQTNFRYHS